MASAPKWKPVRNYLERMQENWEGLCTQVEGGKKLLGEDAREVGWPLDQWRVVRNYLERMQER